jgi:hypothetical protein
MWRYVGALQSPITDRLTAFGTTPGRATTFAWNTTWPGGLADAAVVPIAEESSRLFRLTRTQRLSSLSLALRH